MLIEKLYPRQKALRERTIMNVPEEFAEDNGFYVTVAITKGLYRLLKYNIPVITEKTKIAQDDYSLKILNQDYWERLSDVLWTTNLERNKDRNRKKKEFSFSVFLPHFETVKNKAGDDRQKLIPSKKIKFKRDRGDHGELVFTIMLAEENCIW